ncbi:hypothetical protein [Amaricoccus sp.]|uniref:hypothetical protein n=1 Tax=Amaricoccus sp. TaxID=1872485 RepID=UPI001B3DD713|nr:hypothetical protein [Amaricoccus sp.]MBP7003814.1 hypothetical protein [Amaricoccus sp.]
MARVAAVLRSEWSSALAREGVAPVTARPAPTTGDDLPCPACGTAAPLVAGACSDCGLQLDDAPAASCGTGGCGPKGCG